MTIAEVLTAAGADYDKVLDRFCENEEMLRKYLVDFCRDATYQKLQLSVSAEHYEEIEFNAHSLKGISATLGFVELSEACGTLVIAARKGYAEQLQTLFGQVAAEFTRVAMIVSKLDKIKSSTV